MKIVYIVKASMETILHGRAHVGLLFVLGCAISQIIIPVIHYLKFPLEQYL